MCHNPTGPTTHTITISATTGTPKPLDIKDDEGHHGQNDPEDAALTTAVDAGDTVIWKAEGDISSIQNIIDKSANNVFSSGPAQVPGNPKSWSGVIATNASGIESYSIEYNVNGAAGNPYIEDPKLSVRPKQTN